MIKKRTVMASLILTPGNQIQRLNAILGKVKTLHELNSKQLTAVLEPKSWSIIEIIEHLNIAYVLYVDRVDNLLHELPNVDEGYVSFKARLWQRFIIDGTRPKGKQRKWKMKTLKRFVPLLNMTRLERKGIDEIFQKFESLHLHLKNAILESRTKDVATSKIDSAIGPLIKFYLPECFEFLLVHLERHMVQINQIVERD